MWACDEVSWVAEVVGALALEALPARRGHPDLTRAAAVHLLRYGGISSTTLTISMVCEGHHVNFKINV